MNNGLIITISILYLLLLFGVAYYAEYRSAKRKSIVNNPYIYSLSLAVYCTAWTFYGSVGRAATTGIEFLYTYLGPTLMAPLFWLLLRKIIRISKAQHITSIADFISTRYGKNISLGIVVTILCVVGIIPYIAIQLKAISSSIQIVSGGDFHSFGIGYNVLKDSSLYIAIGLSAFVILFGTRNIDATEKHEGLVVATAFESLVKLIAFIAAGWFVTYVIFNGFTDIIAQAQLLPNLKSLFVLQNSNMYVQAFATITLSMLGVLFLPRQFQVAVVENVQEKHLNKAMWLFPLYLFIINIFVIPIAFGGAIVFNHQNINADTYVLSLPMQAHKSWLTLLVYIGGFSAASSMIIVETIALSTMISNSILIPTLLSVTFIKEKLGNNMSRFILYSRRFSIICIIFVAYLYDKLVAEKFSLVSIGMVSFVAVAQFAPAVIGGIYWKSATKNGALIGILIGFAIWFFTLVIPSMTTANIISSSILEEGLFHIALLKPLTLFGLTGFDAVTNGFFWSIFFNTLCYVAFSLFTERKRQEIYQAEIFVDVFKYAATANEGSVVWKGTAYIPDLKTLLANFLGTEKTNNLLQAYAKKNKITFNAKGKADPALVDFAEKLLAGIIGSASARIMVKSVVKEEEVSIEEVLNILRESQVMKENNKELRKKSIELNRATQELRSAYDQMKQLDELKDEFLYTVTHELRTPLTSIRALSEILYDNPDLDTNEKQTYLEAVVKETERLSHLITQVLNLERYDSGRVKLNLTSIDMAALLYETAEIAKPLVNAKHLRVHHLVQNSMPPLIGDKDLLSQVLYNLISNAAKYAKTNICINAAYTNNYYRLGVFDDGPGVASELHELIFDKFFQAKNQTLKKPEGSGLGLAITKKIVEMHNGKIWIESSENQGANFMIELPHFSNSIAN